MQQHQSYSLKKRLIVYVSIFSLLLGCVLVFAAYKTALEEINEILDAQMQNLAERVAAHDPKPTKSQFDQHKRYHEEDLFVDVWTYESKAHQTHHLKLLVPPVEEAGFYTHNTPQDEWHTYILPLGDMQIQVSQQESVRQHLAVELAGNMFIPYLVFIPFALLALGWLIQRSLKPLEDFKQELAKRDAFELSAISHEQYPEEIAPTIHEMNHLFERILLSQQEQRQFIADAAHELRTPITALNLQMQILLQKFPQDEALHNLSKGLIRIQHLVSQLLSLAKQDASVFELERKQTFDLKQVAANCVEQLIHLAMQKDIDLGMEQQQSIALYSLEPTVHSIIFNLIDNAIKYTPVQGVINVSVMQQAELALVVVEDSGPGIDPALYEQIRKRFYRIYNHEEVGSGLGLAIVDKAAAHIGAHLDFAKSETLGGLKVTIQIPLKPLNA